MTADEKKLDEWVTERSRLRRVRRAASACVAVFNETPSATGEAAIAEVETWGKRASEAIEWLRQAVADHAAAAAGTRRRSARGGEQRS